MSNIMSATEYEMSGVKHVDFWGGALPRNNRRLGFSCFSFALLLRWSEPLCGVTPQEEKTR